MQDGGDAFGPSPCWELGRYGIGVHLRVIVVRGVNLGGVKQCLMKGPVLATNEFKVCKIEIAEGVVVSTPSATYLMGLLHQGTPLTFSCPFTSALALRNKVHSP